MYMKKTHFKFAALFIFCMLLLNANAFAQDGGEEGASDFILFLGHFHPIVLHLPIGFLLLAFMMEIASSFKRFQHLKKSVGFSLLVGAISSFFCSTFGLFFIT